MVAPGIRGGNGFNADLCAEERGAPGAPPASPRVRGLRGGSAGAPRGPGHGLCRSRCREPPCPGWTRDCWPAWGETRVPPGPDRRDITGGNKFSCRRRAAGAARGVWHQGDGGRRQRSGMGFSPSILVAKVAAKLRERNFPSFTLHGHAEGRLPLPGSLWLHHKNLPSSSPVLILVLGLVDGAVAITSHSFWLQKQRASQKQGN